MTLKIKKMLVRMVNTIIMAWIQRFRICFRFFLLYFLNVNFAQSTTKKIVDIELEEQPIPKEAAQETLFLVQSQNASKYQKTIKQVILGFEFLARIFMTFKGRH